MYRPLLALASLGLILSGCFKVNPNSQVGTDKSLGDSIGGFLDGQEGSSGSPEIQLKNFRSISKSFARVTGVGADPITRGFMLKHGNKLSIDGKPMQMSAPELMTAAYLATHYCTQAYFKERALPDDSPDRILFKNVIIPLPTASGYVQASNGQAQVLFGDFLDQYGEITIQNLARAFWGRDATPEELAVLMAEHQTGIQTAIEGAQAAGIQNGIYPHEFFVTMCAVQLAALPSLDASGAF